MKAAIKYYSAMYFMDVCNIRINMRYRHRLDKECGKHTIKMVIMDIWRES